MNTVDLRPRSPVFQHSPPDLLKFAARVPLDRGPQSPANAEIRTSGNPCQSVSSAYTCSRVGTQGLTPNLELNWPDLLYRHPCCQNV